MERKNLFLAAILLVGMNCPINTNTAGVISSFTNPQGFSWTAIGATAVTATVGPIGWRALTSAIHTPTEIGHVNVATNDIKEILVKVHMGAKRYSQKVKWDTKNTAGKQAFLTNINREFKFTDKQSADFTYEVSLIMKQAGIKDILLTKPMKNSPTITLNKTEHTNFATVLWDNVISHVLTLEDDCKTGATWKEASALPNAAKFDIEHTTEITEINCTFTPTKSLATAAPLAITARFIGNPGNNLYAYGAYFGAFVMSRAMKKKIGNSHGLNLELPKRKVILAAETTKDEADARLNAFILRQSARADDITLDEWNTELTRLKDAHRAAGTAQDKLDVLRQIKDMAKFEKTFKITRVSKLTDKVSRATFHYATPTETITTGALRNSKVTKLSDLNIDLLSGIDWNNITALCTIAGNSLSSVADFLNPFGDDEDSDTNDFTL